MLNIMSILPLLKGWDYKVNTWTRTVKKGEVIEVERIGDTGVLIALTLTTNDCYGGFRFTTQSADLNSIPITDYNAKTIKDFGNYMPNPNSYVNKYNQPNPNSSAGVFLVSMTMSGFYGATIPLVPTTIVQLALTKDSTQNEALVSVGCGRLIITDKKQFIKSLRAVLGANTIQEIDPALLIPGTQEITEKGWSEKS